MENELIKVKLKDIKIGMCLGNHVVDNFGKQILSAGNYLTSKRQIEMLYDMAIKEVYIDYRKSLVSSQSPKEIVKREAEVKKEFENTDKILSNLKSALPQMRILLADANKIVELMMNQVRGGKSFDKESMIKNVLELKEKTKHNPQAMFSLINLKKNENFVFKHSIHVTALALTLGAILNLDASLIQAIGIGSVLHDIGKAKLPFSIVHKTGSYTKQEYDIMTTHTVIGEKICLQNKITNKVIVDIVKHHHECYDGTGYPSRLSKNQIDKYISIVSICDYYEGITSPRTYKKTLAPSQAISKIFHTSNIRFDRRLVSYFIKMIGIYPVGSFVRLNSGRVGIVLGFSHKLLLNPILKILLNSNGSVSRKKEIIILNEVDDFIVEIATEFKNIFKLEDIL